MEACLFPIHHSLQHLILAHHVCKSLTSSRGFFTSTHPPKLTANAPEQCAGQTSDYSIPTIQDLGGLLVSGRVISIHQLILQSILTVRIFETPQFPTLDPLQNKHP